ncbi:MAG: hypothetical protein WC470_03575 [Candidatus Paceibacterota bacterium]
MPKNLSRLIIVFVFIFAAVIGWYFFTKNQKDVFGPFEKEPDIFVSNSSFAIAYERSGEHFVNINKKIYGPYKAAKIDSAADKHFGFAYMDSNNNWFANIDNVIAGPYQNIGDIIVSQNKFGFSYEKGGQWYANINNIIYGPYSSVKSLAVSDYNFIFVYPQAGQDYVSVNGQDEQQLENVESVSANIIGVAFVYTVSGEKYINFNKKVFGPFGSDTPALFSNGFAFAYFDNGNWLLNQNDINLGPYDFVKVLKNSQFTAFYYKKNSDKRCYISTNSRALGPYDCGFMNGSVSQNKVGLSYLNNGNWYAVVIPAK